MSLDPVSAWGTSARFALSRSSAPQRLTLAALTLNRAEFMESARSSDWSNCRPYDFQVGDRRRTSGPVRVSEFV